MYTLEQCLALAFIPGVWKNSKYYDKMCQSTFQTLQSAYWY